MGGTRLAAGRVDGAGVLTDRRAAPTPADGGPEPMWERLAELVTAVRRGDEAVVGVGCGGPMEPDGRTVSPLNIPAWTRFPLHERMAGLARRAGPGDQGPKGQALGEGWG